VGVDKGSDKQAMESGRALAVAQGVQDRLIARRLPGWMDKVDPGDFGLLAQALQRGLACRQQLASAWARVEPIDRFAKARLQQALDAHAGALGDVDQYYFRQWYTFDAPVSSYFTSRLPTKDSDYFDTPLLSAALINFTAEQARASGQFRRNALVDGAGNPLARPSDLAFAGLCRDLDLGSQYQQHLAAVLDGLGEPVSGANTFKAVLGDLYSASMLVDAIRACAQGQLSRAELALVSDLCRSGKAGRLGNAPVVAKQLQAFGCNLQQIVVLDVIDEGIIRDTSRRVLVYIPGDSQGAWNVADDLESFARKGLGMRLRNAQYRQFFARFVRQRDCARFFSAVIDRVGDVADWATRELDQHMNAYPLPLFGHLAAQRIAQIKDDAALIAPPVAGLDRAAQRAHERHLRSLGWTLAGLAAFFVPAVGAVMLAVMAWDLLDEVFQSVQNWRQGDTSAALDHLVHVGRDVAVVAATAAGLKVAQVAWRRAAVVDRMVPAALQEGSSKLWDQDLSPYRCGPPPVEATLDGQGIHRLGQQCWIEMEGHYYRVYEERGGYWYLEGYDNHAPLLEHNGAGAWRLWSERPAEWQGEQRMFRRLGRAFGELDDRQIEDVMTVHGLEGDHLRALHVHGRAPEAELVDTVNRVRLANRLRDLQQDLRAGVAVREPSLLEQLRVLLGETQASPEALAESIGARRRMLLQALYDEQNVTEGESAILCRDFTSLHRLAAQQLLSEASEVERQALLETGRIPLSLGLRARRCVLRIQVARIGEGLFIDTPQTFAFARGVLKLLHALPGVPQGWRWVLLDDDGLMPMYQSDGEGQEWRLTHQEGVFVLRDAQGAELGPPGELFEVLADAFSGPQRSAMGIEAPFAQNLRRALLRSLASQRQALAEHAGVSAADGFMRPPYRLADGRIGYPLCGGRRRIAHDAPRSAIARLRLLYPDLDDDRLTQWLAAPEVAQDPEGALDDLETRFEALREALRLWRRNGIPLLEWDARGQMKKALIGCWRFRLPPLALPIQPQQVMFAMTDLDLRALPYLPPSVQFPHIEALVLRGMPLKKIPEAFLQAFPNLHTLEVTHCKLEHLPLPAALREKIRFLDLSDNKLVFHREQGAMIGGCTALRYLNLSRNPLGMSFSLRTLPELNSLLLVKAQLRSFPIGALDSPRLDHLDMSDNSLARLPEDLTASRLWRQERVRLVNCNVPLPAVQLRSWYEPENSEIPVRLRWQDYVPPKQRKALATRWREVELEPGSERFFRLLHRLTDSADFGFDTTARFLAIRLLEMLETMEEYGNEALRDELFASAEIENCADNATLCFSNLEVRIRVWEAHQRDLAYDTEHALLKLGGQLWRLETLDTFARRHAAGLPNRGRKRWKWYWPFVRRWCLSSTCP
jgi:hypothetical protein